MVLGSDGTVFLVRFTQSEDFPFTLNSPSYPIVPNGYESSFFNMFATAIDPTLSKLVYSDYLGEGVPFSLTLDSMNDLYVSGTSLLGLPPLANATVSDVSTGGFYSELDHTGKPISVSEFGGHDSTRQSERDGIDSSGDIYLAGFRECRFW